MHHPQDSDGITLCDYNNDGIPNNGLMIKPGGTLWDLCEEYVKNHLNISPKSGNFNELVNHLKIKFNLLILT